MQPESSVLSRWRVAAALGGLPTAPLVLPLVPPLVPASVAGGTGTPHLLVVQASVEHSFASVQSAPSAFFGAHTGVVFVSSQT